jgi:cyclase
MNTLRARIIPSLLMENGSLIKTKQFKEAKYVGDPINTVKIFNEKKVDELTIFDIGAWKKAEPNFKLLEKISNEARMPLCYGGGIKSQDHAARIIGLGFEKISISRQALLQATLVEEIASRVGAQSTVITLDVKKKITNFGWDIFTDNGEKRFSEDLDMLLSQLPLNSVGELIINSIDREGLMSGYDLELAKFVANRVGVPITMLGGAGSPEHMSALIREIGIVGAAAGSMFVFKGIHRAVLINYIRPIVI